VAIADTLALDGSRAEAELAGLVVHWHEAGLVRFALQGWLVLGGLLVDLQQLRIARLLDVQGRVAVHMRFHVLHVLLLPKDMHRVVEGGCVFTIINNPMSQLKTDKDRQRQ
jgi:hypothetical protein